MIAGAGASGASRGPLFPAVRPSEYSNTRFFTSQAVRKTRAHPPRARGSCYYGEAAQLRHLVVLERDQIDRGASAQQHEAAADRQTQATCTQPAAQTRRRLAARTQQAYNREDRHTEAHSDDTTDERPQGRGSVAQGVRRIALPQLFEGSAAEGPKWSARYRRGYTEALPHGRGERRPPGVPKDRVHAPRGPQEAQAAAHARGHRRREPVGREAVTGATLVLLCVMCVSGRLCEPKRDLLWGSNPAACLRSQLRCVDGDEACRPSG